MKELERNSAAFHEQLQVLHFQEAVSADAEQHGKLSEALENTQDLRSTTSNFRAEQNRHGGMLNEILDIAKHGPSLAHAREHTQTQHASLEDIRNDIGRGHDDFYRFTERK